MLFGRVLTLAIVLRSWTCSAPGLVDCLPFLVFVPHSFALTSHIATELVMQLAHHYEQSSGQAVYPSIFQSSKSISMGVYLRKAGY
jgi:hypothetical protein